MMDGKREILKRVFGYDEFRDRQEDIINCILSGRDCFAVMPTGAGKSMCYQLPAIMMDGVCIVVSPLISLMKDQVTSLVQLGVRAAYINSSLSESQIQKALANARSGVYKIIYVAPERLETQKFLDFACSTEISMVSVDEAHCVSQWGQDFRSSYLRISSFISRLPNRPVVGAFTATATEAVQKDIVAQLALRNPLLVSTGFDRKNLRFLVARPKDKMKELEKFLSHRMDQSGIVYCSTRKTVDMVHEKLERMGFKSARYHAGLDDNERRKSQEDFLYDRVFVMAATNAFGMGIDKSNVSYVVHYNMPMNIEGYYQEAGRAGRDGSSADCMLFYGAGDIITSQYLIESGGGDYADSETERILKERDWQRLKSMIVYCHTHECLRAYILRYFNEKSAQSCMNCGSCLEDLEECDVTEDAIKVLSCVIKTHSRFGAKIIIDTLRGAKSKRLIEKGMDKLSLFSSSSMSEERLEDIVWHMIAKGYLASSDDQYQILRRGINFDKLLNMDEKVIVCFPRESGRKAPESRKIKQSSTGGQADPALFEKLRRVRQRLAQIQGIPAFHVFPDSALVDMCLRLPSNEEEFLEVSGVGGIKCARYGRQFIEAIEKYRQGSVENEESIEIEQSDEPVSVSVIADRISCVFLERGMNKLTAANLNKWLIFNSYLKEEESKNKIPTEKGKEIGIIEVEREQLPNYAAYTEKAQDFIQGSLDSIAEFLQG
jgi:ATP-dependent DNA helicase RecQ